MFSTETLQKIRQYIWNMWNKMDLLGILLVVLAFSLRWTESTMEVARTLYCLSCLVWCLRLLYIYTPSSYFGTKLIMIYKMVSGRMTIASPNDWSTKRYFIVTQITQEKLFDLSFLKENLMIKIIKVS